VTNSCPLRLDMGYKNLWRCPGKVNNTEGPWATLKPSYLVVLGRGNEKQGVGSVGSKLFTIIKVQKRGSSGSILI
jgi:hypothetical protein